MATKPFFPTGLGAVQITLPAAVAGNIGQLEKTMRSLAEQLGCPKCMSGYDCRFELQRELLFDSKLGLTKPEALREAAPVAPTVRVNLAGRTAYNIDAMINSVRKLAELTGHAACATGCNLFFERFRDRLFNVDAVGRINQIKATR